MIELKRYEKDAKYLASKVVTHWETYDFNEECCDPEKRVPRITFGDVKDVIVRPRQAQYIKGFAYEQFIRKYEVEYNGGKYIFTLTVDAPLGHVSEYRLSATLFNEKEFVTLLSSRLEHA